MTALITVRQGGSVIACDRGCYNAKHEQCDCQLCGGVNHGIGLERATANTRRLAPKWVEAAGEGAEVELDETVQQDPLFTIGDHPMSDSPQLPDFDDLVEDALALARQAATLLATGYAPGTECGWQRHEALNEATRGIRQAVDALDRARG